MSNEEDQGHQVTYCCSDDALNHVLSIFGSSAEQKSIGGLGPYENIMSHGVQNGDTSGTNSKFATNSTGIQGESDASQQEEEDDTPAKQDDGKCRPQKRHRSAQVHNLTERLRRQRLKEKMRSLQQLIPNCNKRDKASTLDDAINYIKNLQYQLQIMSMGTGFPSFHSPWTAMSFQQGTHIPALPPYQQTRPIPGMGYRNGVGSGIDQSGVNFSTIGLHCKQHCPVSSNPQLEYGVGIRSGCESSLSSVNIPMNQIGMHSKRCALPTGLQLAQGVSEGQTFQNAGYVSEPLTCSPLDHVIGQYERLVHNGTLRTSSTSWDMGDLPHMPSFSEASESFS